MQPQFRLSRVAQAAESIAEADVVGSRISREQQWGLAPLHGALACARPGFLLQGPFGRANFPGWLGRNSTNIKRARLLRECASHMQLHASGDKAEVRQAYIPALRSKLLKPLLERGNDGIPDVLAALDEVSRESPSRVRPLASDSAWRPVLPAVQPFERRLRHHHGARAVVWCRRAPRPNQLVQWRLSSTRRATALAASQRRALRPFLPP